MHIRAPASCFSIRVDVYPFQGANDPQHRSFRQHFPAPNTGALRNVFNVSDRFLRHLTNPFRSNELLPIPAFAIAAVFAVNDNRIAVGIVLDLDVFLLLFLALLFVLAGG